MMITTIFLLWNSFVFLLMAWDKYKAKHKKHRISEAVLLSAILCFGAIGGGLGMFLCHHKTKKQHFYLAVILGYVLYIGLFVLYYA